MDLLQEETQSEKNKMSSTRPIEDVDPQHVIPEYIPTLRLRSFLDKASLYTKISPDDEENDLSYHSNEGSEISSSDSSTVLSESTPHWVDYFEPDPWADHLRPPLKITEYDRFSEEEEDEESKEKEEQSEEILSDRTIIEGMSFLSATPLIYQYSLNKLQLPGKGLSNIRRIKNYQYLQYVDFSNNNLTDLTPLGNLPFLMYLDVSFNKLVTVLTFKAPLNLTYVNFSHNRVLHIDDLTDFWSLIKLNLSYNYISKIEGLQNLRFLRVLDLSFNLIERFENLNFLRITHLFLQNNKISEFDEDDAVGMKTLQCIYYVNLDNNKLKSLALFKDSTSIQKISLVGNQIGEVFEMENLKASVNLKELNLLKNPVIEWPEYRGMAIGTVPSLCMLDGISVQSDEKVNSKNTFDPDIRLVAARNYSLLLIMEQLNNPIIESHIFPVDERPLPIVILVGPVGSKKGVLAKRISEQFESKILYGLSHTSRSPGEDESEGHYYHFVTKDKINEMALNGNFLTFTEILGDSYGFERMELTKAYDKQCLCITRMDLVGASAMVNRGLNPYLILTIPQSEDVHRRRLRFKPYIKNLCTKGHISEPKILGQKSMQKIRENIFTHSFLDTIVRNHSIDKSKSQDDTTDTESSVTKEESTSSSFIETILTDFLDVVTKEPKDMSQDPIFNEVKRAIFTDSLLDCIVKNASKASEHELCSQCALKETRIRLMLQSREDYLRTYAQKKEFFFSLIYTDDLEEAYKNLVEIVKHAYRSAPQMPPIFINETEIFKASIPDRLKTYMTEIDKHHEVYEQEKSNIQNFST